MAALVCLRASAGAALSLLTCPTNSPRPSPRPHSDEEANLLRHYRPNATVVTISNIHDFAPRNVTCSNRNGIMFVGNFNHPPNQQVRAGKARKRGQLSSCPSMNAACHRMWPHCVHSSTSCLACSSSQQSPPCAAPHTHTQAVEHLLKEVLPIVKNLLPPELAEEFRVHIVGSNQVGARGCMAWLPGASACILPFDHTLVSA